MKIIHVLTNLYESTGNRNFEEDDMMPNYCRTDTECESAGAKTRSSHDPFRNLRFLNVNGTLLASWDDIERIASFPGLKSLRIQGCPLFEVKFKQYIFRIYLIVYDRNEIRKHLYNRFI